MDNKKGIIKKNKKSFDDYTPGKKFILDGKFSNGDPARKFCLHTATREFIIGSGGSIHANLIRAYGPARACFDDYVRGIYWKDKNIIYFRDYSLDNAENFKILYWAKEILERLGRKKKIKVILGSKYLDVKTEKLLAWE